MNQGSKLVGLAAALAVAALSLSMDGSAEDRAESSRPFDPARGMVLHGTIVTMDDRHTVIEAGRVLVRNNKIVAVWQGERPPVGTDLEGVVVLDFGPSALIFPGMINLHDHPTFDTGRLWPAPSSHAQPALARPLGTEPYANRYQWNGMKGSSPPEIRRLVQTPQNALVATNGFNLHVELTKHAKVKGLVGGQTTTQNALSSLATDGLLARNAESANFGRQRIRSEVQAIDSLNAASVAALLSQMQNGQVDAWLVHLAEGVRDGDRRPGDPASSRAEFASLKAKGLLTDMTAIVHGTGLESADFLEMRAAPSIRNDLSGDGLGTKLVWSPLSNLLLYGRTANVYEALSAGVLVSLGTDWTPSGSRNLLGELKVADIALRDPALLGASRHLMPRLSVGGKPDQDAENAERALDRVLVDMVTRNPARTLRWEDEVGSIGPGKTADLFVITKPGRAPRAALPYSPYRSLIDATERDVRLVMVGGDPLVADPDIMARLKPGDFEAINSSCECYRKAVDVTKAGVPRGDQTFAFIEQTLGDALVAFGGDSPPPGGGPADLTNTYSYAKQRFTLPFPMTDAQFLQFVIIPTAGLVGGKINLERLTLAPLLTEDDDFFFDLLGARVNPVNGLLDDPTPPFLLYPSNANQVQNGVDPFAPEAFEDRWYPLPKLADEAGHGGMCVVGAVTCERR
jgi:cytosine/adenosine deaminase-related metal-dependent hydrolase